MSIVVAASRRDAKIGELRERYDSILREHNRPPIGATGQAEPYLIRRRQMMLARMRELEAEMAELAYLEGEALCQAFDPAPRKLPDGVNFTDTLARGPRVPAQVVVQRS